MNVIDLNKICGPTIDPNIEVDVTDLDRLKTLIEDVVPPYIDSLSTLPDLRQTDVASPWAIKKSPIHYMIIINDLQLDNERLSALQANFFRQDVRVINALLEKSRADFSKIHDAHYDAVKSQHQWSDWSEYAQYAGFAGAAAIAVAAAAGGAPILIVTASALSAVIGIGNRIATNTGLWREVASWFTSSEALQNKMAQRIDTGLTWTAVALGAIGGTGAIAQGVAGVQTVTSTVGITNGAVTVSTNLGSAYSTKQVEDLNGQKTLNSADQTYQKRMIQELSSHIRTNFEQTKSIQEMLQKCND